MSPQQQSECCRHEAMIQRRAQHCHKTRGVSASSYRSET
jgi:hypothetical protein